MFARVTPTHEAALLCPEKDVMTSKSYQASELPSCNHREAGIPIQVDLEWCHRPWLAAGLSPGRFSPFGSPWMGMFHSSRSALDMTEPTNDAAGVRLHLSTTRGTDS